MLDRRRLSSMAESVDGEGGGGRAERKQREEERQEDPRLHLQQEELKEQLEQLSMQQERQQLEHLRELHEQEQQLEQLQERLRLRQQLPGHQPQQQERQPQPRIQPLSHRQSPAPPRQQGRPTAEMTGSSGGGGGGVDSRRRFWRRLCFWVGAIACLILLILVQIYPPLLVKEKAPPAFFIFPKSTKRLKFLGMAVDLDDIPLLKAALAKMPNVPRLDIPGIIRALWNCLPSMAAWLEAFGNIFDGTSVFLAEMWTDRLTPVLRDIVAGVRGMPGMVRGFFISFHNAWWPVALSVWGAFCGSLGSLAASLWGRARAVPPLFLALLQAFGGVLEGLPSLLLLLLRRVLVRVSGKLHSLLGL
ncbi:unnamed protein product, partial [Ectocarpus sp. 12 AP-2014]